MADDLSLSSTGSHFNRQQQQQQHSHATSCRHFQLGPQAPLPMDFPMPHPGQPQSGINPHLAPPSHQHGPPLHPPLNPLPAPQFQDIPAPPFLPQALHQQYLLQQQILEAQHRHILPPSRYPHGFCREIYRKMKCLAALFPRHGSVGGYKILVVASYLRSYLYFPRMFSNASFVLVDAPQREFPTSPTDCGLAMSLHPHFMSNLSLWCSSPATWQRAQTGKQYTSYYTGNRRQQKYVEVTHPSNSAILF